MFSKRLLEVRQRARYTYGVFPKSKLNYRATNAVIQTQQQLHPSFCIVRHASSTTVVPPVITKAIEAVPSTSDDTLSLLSIEEVVKSVGPIPEAPGLPGPKVLEILSNGEPSFSSLGLGGWSPSGILQQLLELAHVTSGWTWGWTIVIVAATIRILCFKLVVRQRQESAKMATVMPQMQFLQQKMLEARQQNDIIQASRYAMELSTFTKTNPSIFGPLKYGIIQGVILLSFTAALREMCKLPVEALQTGGFWIIPDLTMTDPTYILPFINGLLFYLHISTSKELHTMFPTKNPYLIHGGMAAISGVLFFISMNFQGAIVLYWISSQCVTVIQHKVLSHPKVKTYYNLDNKGNEKIAQMIKSEAARKKKSATDALGFWARWKEAQTNSRLADEVKRRSDIDSAAFERAGREPIRKTYKYDITKIKK